MTSCATCGGKVVHVFDRETQYGAYIMHMACRQCGLRSVQQAGASRQEARLAAKRAWDDGCFDQKRESKEAIQAAARLVAGMLQDEADRLKYDQSVSGIYRRKLIEAACTINDAFFHNDEFFEGV